jgi:hypothetical protein
MRRVVLAALIAAGILVFSPAPAGAWFSYCDWDPLVPVVTPAGHVVLLYDSVWTSSPLDLALPLATSKVSRVYSATGSPETAVDTAITVPTGLLFRYAVTDEVTTGLLGSGNVLAKVSGMSGQTLHLKYILSQA